ncbi:MAG: hypothetical protein WBE53_24495, partial [Pseudolabrys sp.]
MRDAQYLRAQAEFCLEVASQISDLKTVDKLASRRGALSRRGRGNRSYATGAIAALIAHHGVWNSTNEAKPSNRKPEDETMIRGTTEITQQHSERAMQATNLGMNWALELA